MIKNKYLSKPFDELRNKNELPFHSDFGISGKDILKPHPEYQAARRIWEKTDIEIKNNFEYLMKTEYSISQNTINTAYEIQEYSDNGYSYQEVERYIVILQNYHNKENE